MRNKKLIIRDWCFVDYFGIPYTEPTYKNSILETLNEEFNISNIYILRHPLELYISCFKSFSFFKDNSNLIFL